MKDKQDLAKALEIIHTINKAYEQVIENDEFLRGIIVGRHASEGKSTWRPTRNLQQKMDIIELYEKEVMEKDK